ncbi:hypothetical protein [Phytohabitans rumicis]|uniref:Uncharacterized protein n=1 Tax=Phytohabitans rumicis TaxID=1076125 RepID=A0A6V8L0F7_9ACTN|nr:hypothetical protein [Phytohabitans rumicis]GFJ89080.1 hypothetical protein Prum_027220 [Phytohabitans rumicis]
MLVEAHEEVPFLSQADLNRVRRPDLSVVGGRPLLELTGEAFDYVRHLGPATRLSELEETYLDRPVGETIGDLRCAAYLERSLPTPHSPNPPPLPAASVAAPIKDFRVDQGHMAVVRSLFHDRLPLIDGKVLDRRRERAGGGRRAARGARRRGPLLGSPRLW